MVGLFLPPRRFLAGEVPPVMEGQVGAGSHKKGRTKEESHPGKEVLQAWQAGRWGGGGKGNRTQGEVPLAGRN